MGEVINILNLDTFIFYYDTQCSCICKQMLQRYEIYIPVSSLKINFAIKPCQPLKHLCVHRFTARLVPLQSHIEVCVRFVSMSCDSM